MNTKQILPIIITMVVTGLIIYILMWQRGGPCPCDCERMQQRIEQLQSNKTIYLEDSVKALRAHSP